MGACGDVPRVVPVKEEKAESTKENIVQDIKPTTPIKLDEIVIWIDEDVYNPQNTNYRKELESIGFHRIKCFNNIKDSINGLKAIKFEETYIIVSGRFFIQFIKELKANLINIYIIPKIIIFTFYKENLLTQENSKYINHPFYNLGGIEITFFFVIKFLTNKTMTKIERLELNIVNKKKKKKKKRGY